MNPEDRPIMTVGEMVNHLLTLPQAAYVTVALPDLNTSLVQCTVTGFCLYDVTPEDDPDQDDLPAPLRDDDDPENEPYQVVVIQPEGDVFLGESREGYPEGKRVKLLAHYDTLVGNNVDTSA